jgi:hypothetical protein
VAAAPDASAQPAPAPEAKAPAPSSPVAQQAGPDARAAEIADDHPTGDKAGNPPPAADNKKDKDEEDDETDEEALLRDAVPNAENAVIGEDDAEPTPGAKGPNKWTVAAKGKTTAKTPPPKPAPTAQGAKPAPGPTSRPPATPPSPKVQTAVLHITSAPKGAIVRTKYRVLGRTPINLHFKTGNIYELKLVKSGYNPTTRKVAVNNTKDRKIAVTLKKKPAAKKKHASFFHPHR